MGLQPLEFADCLTDSPFFREKLHEHEKELERTSKSIKTLINDGRELMNAAKNLSKAQKTFSANLKDFKFECIGSQQTDDELVIAASLQEFGRMIEIIEDERDNVLDKASVQFLEPLENFRKKHIGVAKDGKKNFDRQSNKFCQSLERHLNLKTKINDNHLQDADASVEMERRHFYQASMKYVLQLQEVQERKKFEFVEVLLSFMYSWLTFYHQGHEVFKDFKPYTTELQLRLQKTRENFNSTREEAEQLMMKMLEVRGTKPSDQSSDASGLTRQGYLFVFEKKALNLTSGWTKHYCQYYKANKCLILTPYNQTVGKPSVSDKLVLTSCVRRASDSIEKRFCFDITVNERSAPLLVQALSEEDRREWLDAMDGKEPVYKAPVNPVSTTSDDTSLDEVGFNFMKKCIAAIENTGLSEQGLYRVVGVNSKVNKLTGMGLDRRKQEKLALEDASQWEVKTITSAVKSYLRTLPEPLMSFRHHEAFIVAAKHESKSQRIHDVHTLVHKLPDANFRMLELIITHLCHISENSMANLMTVANIGVCFGPTLMRPEQETVAAIMDIKFCNIVVEILIRNFDKIFKSKPDNVDGRVDGRETGVAPTKTRINNHRPPPVKFMAPTPDVIPGANRQSLPQHLQNNHTTPPRSLSPNIAHVYANQAAIQQQTQSYHAGDSGGGGRFRNRPPGIYLPNTETQSNTSSSSDSLNSSQFSPHASMSASTTQIDAPRRSYVVHSPYPNSSSVMNRTHGHLSEGPMFRPISSIDQLLREIDESTNALPDPPIHVPRPRRHSPLPRPYNYPRTSSMISVGSTSSAGTSKQGRRTVRTLYSCIAENESELSFEPNQIIYNVRPSKEPDWLEGTIQGCTGLIPFNYVEFID